VCRRDTGSFPTWCRAASRLRDRGQVAIAAQVDVSVDQRRRRIEPIIARDPGRRDRAVPRRPIAQPEDAQYVLEWTTGVAGFFGASSIERLATEPAIEREARRFKALTVSRRQG
jgi:predicted TIM-barrel enzyme